MATTGTDSGLKFGVLVAALLVGLLIYRGAHPSTTLAADGMDPKWDAAVESSKISGQPTVVLFTAGWCGSCQWLHANVLSRSDIQSELSEHYNFCTIDLTNPRESVQAHASKLGVSGIPTLIRYDSDGKEISRCHALPADEMMAWLKAGE